MTKIAAFLAYIKDFALKNASEAQFFFLQVTERINVKLRIAKTHKKIKHNCLMTENHYFLYLRKRPCAKTASNGQFFLLQVTERVNVKLQIAKIHKKIKRNFENCLQMIRK